MKLKLHNAAGAILLTFAWLASVFALVHLLHQAKLDWIILGYASISFLGLLALVIRMDVAQQAIPLAVKATFGKAAFIFLLVFGWLASMLGLLAVLPFHDEYFFVLWVIWVIILVVIIGYLESKWQQSR